MENVKELTIFLQQAWSQSTELTDIEGYLLIMDICIYITMQYK